MNDKEEVIKDPVYPIPEEEQCDVERDRNGCWYCGGLLIWQSDFNYDEVHGEGEGITTFLTCSNCGAEVQYDIRESEVTDAEGVENE